MDTGVIVLAGLHQSEHAAAEQSKHTSLVQTCHALVCTRASARVHGSDIGMRRICTGACCTRLVQPLAARPILLLHDRCLTIVVDEGFTRCMRVVAASLGPPTNITLSPGPTATSSRLSDCGSHSPLTSLNLLCIFPTLSRLFWCSRGSSVCHSAKERPPSCLLRFPPSDPTRNLFSTMFDVARCRAGLLPEHKGVTSWKFRDVLSAKDLPAGTSVGCLAAQPGACLVTATPAKLG